MASRSKPAYHAAGTLVAGHALALTETAAQMLIDVGFSRAQAVQTLLPLMRQMLDNFEKHGPRAAWTGPASRGDYATLEKHQRALRRHPREFGDSYAIAFASFGPGAREKSGSKPEKARSRSEKFQEEIAVKNLHIPVEHMTLANGLRVVISPDRSAPVVTVGVYYQIGFRLEPRGRSGFAHLFEHMMFQGSENAGKMEHIRLINSSGGMLNGTTNYDITNYFESVPSNALERVLWLEADRMRALKVDDENLRNQRDVVKEEVRVNVMNQPYGGFPWLDLPPVAFRNWPNAHNFYGDFARSGRRDARGRANVFPHLLFAEQCGAADGGRPGSRRGFRAG